MRALFEQAGVIRVETLAELFDTALLLTYQPLPAGPRVAVVGNSSALGVLVADALLGEGMRLAGEPVDIGVTAPPEQFAAAIVAALSPADAGPGPAAGAASDADGGGPAVRADGDPDGDGRGEPGAAAGSPDGVRDPGGADALIAVFVPPVATPGEAYAQALREAAAAVQRSADKPVLAVFFAAEGVPPELAVPGGDGTPVRGRCPATPARSARRRRWRG